MRPVSGSSAPKRPGSSPGRPGGPSRCGTSAAPTPTATSPPQRCQIDHIVPYAKGGETIQENGQVHCGFHNRLRNHGPPGSGGEGAFDDAGAFEGAFDDAGAFDDGDEIDEDDEYEREGDEYAYPGQSGREAVSSTEADDGPLDEGGP